MEEIKKIVCCGCAPRCPSNIRVRDGKIVEQFFEKTDDSPMQNIYYTIQKTCARCQATPEVVDHPERLNYPLKRAGERGENKWQRVTWDQALDDIASRLQQVKDKYGPEGVGFNIAGDSGCSPIEYQRRFMNLFGSPSYASHGQV